MIKKIGLKTKLHGIRIQRLKQKSLETFFPTYFIAFSTNFLKIVGSICYLSVADRLDLEKNSLN